LAHNEWDPKAKYAKAKVIYSFGREDNVEPISWLALLLVRIIEIGTGSTWEQVRKEMNRLHLGHFSTKDDDLYQCTALAAKQRQDFAAVGVEPPPKIVDIHPKS
jgi:hypothetical protein